MATEKTDWLEKIAEENHNGWMAFRVKRKGPVEGSKHEHFMSWSELQEECGVEAMNQDRFVASLVLRGFACGDVNKEEDLRALIHDSIQLWVRLTGEEKQSHHIPYSVAKDESDGWALDERSIQAKRLWVILNQIPNIDELRKCDWIPGRKK